MVRRALRSRSWSRSQRVLPSGISKVFFNKPAPGKVKCSCCKLELHGIPRLNPIRFSNIPKSEKTVNRKFGGSLCSKCSRLLIKGRVVK